MMMRVCNKKINIWNIPEKLDPLTKINISDFNFGKGANFPWMLCTQYAEFVPCSYPNAKVIILASIDE